MSHFREPPLKTRIVLYNELRHVFDINPPKEIIVIDSNKWEEMVDYNNPNINVCDRLINNTMRSRNALYYNNVNTLNYQFHVINRRIDDILSVVKVSTKPMGYPVELSMGGVFIGVTYEKDEIRMDTLITNTAANLSTLWPISEFLYQESAFILHSIFVHEMMAYPD